MVSKGDIVLVPFPFTDLSQTKLRPAVVLWIDSQKQDVTLCFISSRNLNQKTDDEFIIYDSDPEFAQTGLKVSSKVRVTKIITVEYKLLQRRLGKLGKQQLRVLDETLVRAFKINL